MFGCLAAISQVLTSLLAIPVRKKRFPRILPSQVIIASEDTLVMHGYFFKDLKVCVENKKPDLWHFEQLYHLPWFVDKKSWDRQACISCLGLQEMLIPKAYILLTSMLYSLIPGQIPESHPWYESLIFFSLILLFDNILPFSHYGDRKFVIKISWESDWLIMRT